jgi:alpha-methylacyl-CoA racemase
MSASVPALKGPLAGLKVLEIEGIGPGPFAAMALADLGANVLRIARPTRSPATARNPVLGRGRTATLTLDLKKQADVVRLLSLIDGADALIEGFRPDVMERLGLSPNRCLGRNPRLVYGRVTGWGRSGPLAPTAGHDIALTGALYACGTRESGPVPPLNLVGDLGGGGLMLAFGIVCALLEARQSGHGQVVDAAMTDGASTLMGMIHGLRGGGRWPADRAGNILDGSAYFYTCYECADGWMAVGAIETQFREQMLTLLGLESELPWIMAADDRDPSVRGRLANVFKTRSRAEWQKIFDGTDACVSPVLRLDEVTRHEHNAAMGTFSTVEGVVHPNPAPRFSRTPPPRPTHSAPPDADARLKDWGLTPFDVL